MNSKTVLFAAALSVALSASAVADSYYFRSKGGPVASVPGNPETPPDQPATAAIILLSDKYRAGTTISGTLESSLANPTWSFVQTPAEPTIAFATVEGGVTAATAPTVGGATTFQVTATASEGGKSASTETASVTVHPLLAIAGGPAGEIKGTVDQALDTQPVYVLTGLVDAATYTLMQSSAPLSNFGTQCPGLSFSTTNGKFFGTPTGACSLKNLTVKVKDSFDAAEATSGAFSISVLPGPSNVMAWGNNNAGQLGDGTTTQRTTAGPVLSGKNYVNVASGNNHACGLVNDGTVECWGNNGSGQIGDGRTQNRLLPIKVQGLSGVTAIAAGGSTTCAVISGGVVKCWGNNGSGQIGNGNTASPQPTPVQVSGLSGVGVIAVGLYHTCAVVSGGTMKCWGSNTFGQIGNGNTVSPQLSPVQISGLSGVTAVAVGAYHTCAVAAGTMKCWGSNSNGQLGFAGGSQATPMEVSGLSGVSAVAVGNYHSCAIVSGGAVKCWGNNDNGQIGNGNTSPQPTPVQVSGLIGVTAVTAGAHHVCAVVSGGTMKCWGSNNFGQINNGVAGGSQETPVQVLSGVSAIAAGTGHTFAW